MDSIASHPSSGTLFLLFGAWVMSQTLRRYFVCARAAADTKGQSYDQYRNQCCSVSSTCPKLPLDGIFKMIIFVVGVAGEIVSGFGVSRETRLTHALGSMAFFFFSLSGVMDFFVHCSFPIPPDSDYLTMFFAFCMESFIVYYDIHARTSLETQMLTFLVYVVIGCALSTFFEMCFKKNVLPALARAYFTVLQGTWMLQMWMLLKEDDDGDIDGGWYASSYSFITLVFTWHAACVFTFMGITAACVYRLVR